MHNIRTVSVIIATKDRPNDVCRTVGAILRQSQTPFEIIIVDQSLDGASELAVRALFSAHNDSNVRLAYCRQPELDGVNAARNFGLEKATHPIVVFSDDDAELAGTGIEELVRIFHEYPEVCAIGGVITNYSAPGLPHRLFTRLFYLGSLFDERQPVYWAWDRVPPQTLIPTTKINGGMMAFRKDILMQVGGFDSRLRGACVGDDIEVTQRLRHFLGRNNGVVLAPTVRIVHESLGGWKHNPRSLEFHLISQHYLHVHPPYRSRFNKIAFWWMAFGLFIRSALSSVKRTDLSPLRSYIAGLKGVWNGYRDCPFIKPGGVTPLNAHTNAS